MKRYILALLVALGLLFGAAPASAQVYWYAVNGNIFASGPVLFTDGTAAAPAISFGSDQNTGFYSAGGDTVGVATAGLARWRFNGANLEALSDGASLIGAISSLRPGAINIGGRTLTTNTQPILNLAETWNEGSTTFTGIVGNWTNTASASGSKVIDLQVGGISRLNVTVGGTVNFGATTGNTTTGSMSIIPVTTVINMATATGTGTGTITSANTALPVGLTLGVTCRVSPALAGAGLTTFSLGDGTDVDRFGTTLAIDLNTLVNVANYTSTAPLYKTATGSLVLTAAAGVFSTGILTCTSTTMTFTPIGS